MNYNYKGSIVNQLYAAIEKNPEKTIGEILYGFLNKQTLGKHFFEAEDKEIFTSLEKYINETEEEDEPFDDNGWNFFMQKLIVNGHIKK